MKLITRNTDYGIRALIFITQHKQGVVSVSDLVEELGIPRSFLRKILQRLNKKRVLKSYKGKGGGFLLIKPAQKIFLLDLIEIFQKGFKLNGCFFKKKSCPDRNSCILGSKINSIEKDVFLKLKKITLASLVKD